MREYNLGLTLRELFYKCEWWEILALMYASFEDQVLKNKAYEERRKEEEIKQKVKDGRLKGIYKPNMSNALKQKILGMKK